MPFSNRLALWSGPRSQAWLLEAVRAGWRTPVFHGNSQRPSHFCDVYVSTYMDYHGDVLAMVSPLVHLLVRNRRDDTTPFDAATQLFASLLPSYVPWRRHLITPQPA